MCSSARGDVKAPTSVTILIPTFKRPSWLEECLTSCLAQEDVSSLDVDILVIDNCPDRSAIATVSAMARNSTFPIRYLHETKTGVSHVRNTGIANAEGELLALIDDDELASKHWLSEL